MRNQKQKEKNIHNNTEKNLEGERERVREGERENEKNLNAEYAVQYV